MSSSSWTCTGCGTAYPVRSGVLDFRDAPPAANLSFAHGGGRVSEGERVAALLRQRDHGTYRDLVYAYFDQYTGTESVLAKERATLLDAVPHAEAWLYQLRQVIALDVAAGVGAVSVDIGCGTGGMVAVLARVLPYAVGVDADLERLVLAQKLCEELGVRNALFVCGYAEALPFADNCAGLVTAIEVYEHSPNQEQFLSEARRVLIPGRYLYLTTPNRFRLMPEPHVDLWGVGFLPRSLADSYVRFRLGVPYRDKRNPSRSELHRMMRKSFGAHFRFVRERRTQYTVQARIAGALLRYPGVARLVQCFLSGFHVVAWKASAPEAAGRVGVEVRG